MNEKDSTSRRALQGQRVSRRNLIRRAAGATVGAGLLLGSRLAPPTFAEEDEHETCPDLPRPIPHISTPPGQHHFFPGPVDSSYVSSPNTGHDPSEITDFEGVIGQADLFFKGMGTKLDTGESAPYGFHTDWRFFSGVFIGVDGLQHKGTLTFI